MLRPYLLCLLAVVLNITFDNLSVVFGMFGGDLNLVAAADAHLWYSCPSV